MAISENAAVFEKPETMKGWDRDYYHPIARQYYDRAIPALLKLMGVPKGATVLDAGCGPGVHSLRAARAGCHVTAIDISETMLREARARAAAAGVSSAVEFRQEDLTKLSFSDNSFRYVFSWGVIIHIRDVEKALDELCRILERGGSLGLYVTNNGSWDLKLENLARSVLRKPLAREHYSLGSGVWYNLHEERLWNWHFNIPELVRQVEMRGFKLTYRGIGELSELQRRFRRPLRHALLRLNNFCYRVGFPAGPAQGNLLVFRKT